MNIFCVDNSKPGAISLRRRVQNIVPDAQVYAFCAPNEALRQAEAGGCDILLTEIDVGLSGAEGILLADYVRQINPEAGVIFVTVCSRCEHEATLRRIAPDAYITKPFLDEELAGEIRNLRCMAG